jgi:CRISPR-associated endonuclease/helicase Cas3
MQVQLIAHHREADQKVQSILDHLEMVSEISGCFADKINMTEAGALLGLLHDLGKYSHNFQQYIRSATGMLNPDVDDEYVDVAGLKGKIDHSTAGAQWIWNRFHHYGVQGKLAGRMLAVCLASHHGGLIDCLRPDGTDGFRRRITKDDAKTHFEECVENADPEIIHRLEELTTKEFLKNFLGKIVDIVQPDKKESDLVKAFRLGLLTRFLFSCLIDADRIDSADFEYPDNRRYRLSGTVDWQIAIDRLEAKIAGFTGRYPVDVIRSKISQDCRSRAEDPQGIYTLTVPTGGGKTFSSIRWALHHAKEHKLERIIYIIPFTSIIEQNAEEVRKILEKSGDEYPWVLEHHSNLEPEKQTWYSKLSSENWNAPVIFTTMVQFLEVLFGGGTKGVRRMHALARSVLIFDEIQSLPVNCVHLFCNGLQFLVDHASATALLCTATQPLLDDLKGSGKGQLHIPAGNELVPDVSHLFQELQRVTIRNRYRPQGWSREKIAALALSELDEKGNCLVIVNTKDWARQLFETCRESGTGETNMMYHLSTNLCPAHRKRIFSEINQRLDSGEPVLCISTQLIEAGVDVDFNSVIRFLAGLDSIAQAAGRCNRNGRLSTVDVHVVNPE